MLLGIGALAFMLGEPHLEGRNRDATPFEVYFKDPFLAYAYLASIPFFVALCQAYKVLGYAGRDELRAPEVLTAVRTIRYCAMALICFVVVSALFLLRGDPEDRPPGVVMRIVALLGSLVFAAAAATLERNLQNAAGLRSDNDASA